MILRRYMGSGGYSKIPLYEHYVQLLVKEGIQEHQAKELTAILDNQVRQVIYQKSSKYLPGRDYVQVTYLLLISSDIIYFLDDEEV